MKDAWVRHRCASQTPSHALPVRPHPPRAQVEVRSRSVQHSEIDDDFGAGELATVAQRISVVHLRTVFCREVLAQWMLSGSRRGAGVRRSNKIRASRCLWVCSAPLRRKRWSQQRIRPNSLLISSGCRTLTTLAFRRSQICSQPIFVPKRASDARRMWLQFPPIFLMLAIRESRSIGP